VFANILAYPEFLAVALLTVVLVKNAGADRDGEEQQAEQANFFHMPSLAVLNLLPAGYLNWLNRNLMWAGWRSNHVAGNFAAAKLVLFLASLSLVLVAPIPVVAAVALLAYFVPDAFLLVAVKRRQLDIKAALPQALDLMVLCVDAGLGLDAALQRVAADSSMTSHALNDELASLGRDILLGMERSRAYFEVYKRTGVEELKMFGSALNQSTRLGLSIARILRNQSEFLRSRQSQKAEERAAKLPVWMAFPLWFFIMPALMFVIMGPTFITFLQNLGRIAPSWLF
jgi:tight adherence protein C